MTGIQYNGACQRHCEQGEAIQNRQYKAAVVARLDLAIQYAAAYRFNHDGLWNTGSPAFAGDDE